MRILKWAKRILLLLFGLVFLLIIIGFIYEQISRFNTKRELPIQGQLINIGDHSLNCKSMGNGEPLVVFESGLETGGFLPWGKVQDEVSTFSSTFSYSRAGILGSERGDNPKSIEAVADELYALLKKTNHNGPYILVGHSLAGYFLRTFVAKHSSEVVGIVFVDVSHPEQFNRLSSPAPQSPPLWLVKFISSIGIMRLFKIGHFTYPSTSESDSINIITNAYLPSSSPSYLEEQKNIKEYAIEAGKINSFGNIPLIIITGTSPTRDDANFRKQWFQMQTELMNLSSKSEHFLAEKSGHYVQLQQPEIVVQAIEKLIQERRESRKEPN